MKDTKKLPADPRHTPLREALEAMGPRDSVVDHSHTLRVKPAHSTAPASGRVSSPKEAVFSMAGSMLARDARRSPEVRKQIGRNRLRALAVVTGAVAMMSAVAPHVVEVSREVFSNPFAGASQTDTSGPDRVAPAFASSDRYMQAVDNYLATTGQQTSDSSDTETVIVGPDGTVWDIAASRTEGDPRPLVDQITNMNHAEINDGLHPGDRLIVPADQSDTSQAG